MAKKKNKQDFWEDNDVVDYLGYLKPIKLDLSRLRPSTKPITVRMPESLLESLKKLAHKKDVPYQSLMKVFLAERVKREQMVRGN